MVAEHSITFAAHPTSSRFRDITGQRFGLLAVLGFAGMESKRSYWWCRCDCGKVRRCLGTNLTGGKSTTCGCSWTRAVQRRCDALPPSGRSLPEYQVWASMKTRCSNSKDPGFANYGGRGIRVCLAWRESFWAFLADIGERPSASHSIDRFPDNDGHYSCGHCEECTANDWPANCRWATFPQQCRNKRNTHFVTYQGETLPLPEWCERLGLPYGNMCQRICVYGWPAERAFTEPVHYKRQKPSR